MPSRDYQYLSRVLSPTDQNLKVFFSEICKRYDVQRIIFSVGPETSITIAKPQEESIKELFEKKFKDGGINEIISTGSKALTKITAHVGAVTICEFERVATVYDQGHFRKAPSLHESEFFVYDQQNDPKLSVAAEVRGRISKHFSSSRLAESGPSRYVEAVQSEIAALSELSRSITEQLAKNITAQEARFNEHRDRLEAEAHQRHAELEELKEAELKKVALAREEIELRKKELDDRQARHARRALREEITENVKTRLGKGIVSRNSIFGRLTISLICVFGILLGAYQVFNAAIEFSSLQQSLRSAIDPRDLSFNSPEFLYILLKTVVGGAVGTVLLFYLLSYWRRKISDDEEFERSLERYGLDIDRASWIVETVIEVRSEDKDKDVPEAWMAGVTANLFPYRISEEQDEETNALDALGELLKKGARLNVGHNGAEIELTPSASRRVGRSGG